MQDKNKNVIGYRKGIFLLSTLLTFGLILIRNAFRTRTQERLRYRALRNIEDTKIDQMTPKEQRLIRRMARKHKRMLRKAKGEEAIFEVEASFENILHKVRQDGLRKRRK